VRAFLVLTIALAALALTGGGSPASIPPCTGAQLSGTFSVIYGSAGGGQQLIRATPSKPLRPDLLRSAVAFAPRPGRLDRARRPLPTKVVPVVRHGLTAIPSGGTLVAPVKPPTPVCEHGQMQVSVLSPP
jgi:hypothetical protein